ncbi:MAG: tRNA 4-thiouridine(8) synthase ThiI [Candidatus Wallbacteria bacterium]|nr:tRNA 4-thiouridine(8) synthase ThiI [Candidatus Wallbacteria bacterium]
MTTKSALALLSGGLDSTLAILVAREAGASVKGITFTTPFYGAGPAQAAAEDIGLDLVVCDIFDEFLPILRNPSHGYGKNLNPCLDCHTLMVKKALEMLVECSCDYIITGEVLGERPMSQNRNSLDLVSSRSGAKNLLLRPLSAKLLPPTLPETEGWIDRELLWNISGRSRKIQLELAEKFGLSEFQTPAGGCLLTDPNFTRRLRRFLADPDLSRRTIELIKIGRHFFIEGFHVVISRNETENAILESMAENGDATLFLDDLPSPFTLVLKGIAAPDQVLEKAGALTLRYSKYRLQKNLPLKIGERRIIISEAASEHSFTRI